MKRQRIGFRYGTYLMVIASIGGFSGRARAGVEVSGPDSNAGSYSTAALMALANAGDSVTSGGLTGITLWGLLGGAPAASPTSPIYGDITTSTPTGENGKNAILRYYVIGSNGVGQQSVVSLGEIDPSFGGTAAAPPFIAYQSTSSGLLAAPELVVPGGSGRDLTGLTGLQLLAVSALPAGGSGVSASVQLSGAVANPGSYDKAKLAAAFTPVTEVISSDTYTGVPLYTFLDPSDSNITSQIVVTQATDGYEVALSLAELDPSLGGNAEDLLPYADTSTDFPGDGVARIILPDDNKHGRWVSNVDAIQVYEVPEPGSCVLLAMGVASLAVLRRFPGRWLTAA